MFIQRVKRVDPTLAPVGIAGGVTDLWCKSNGKNSFALGLSLDSSTVLLKLETFGGTDQVEVKDELRSDSEATSIVSVAATETSNAGASEYGISSKLGLCCIS
ncbi:hypothetical protein Fot_37532 [Forsythia ovata]|uniref:Uncharacterized protein n=1 Tax=Forsythia ovata TaxID=205694 RepID=A0ABD1RZ96_9LAMI